MKRCYNLVTRTWHIAQIPLSRLRELYFSTSVSYLGEHDEITEWATPFLKEEDLKP
jgi:hypothetical protein